ncbi:MAG: PilZ domain-containing protein [Candidatus Omnitrophota bacterium]
MWFLSKGEDARNSRLHRRLRIHCLAKYSVEGARPLKKHMVTPRNISASGLVFLSEAPIARKSVLKIEMYLPPLKSSFTATADVVRTSRIKETGQYWIGAHFTDMDPGEKEAIGGYIQGLSTDPSMKRFLDKKGERFKRNN